MREFGDDYFPRRDHSRRLRLPGAPAALSAPVRPCPLVRVDLAGPRRTRRDRRAWLDRTARRLVRRSLADLNGTWTVPDAVSVGDVFSRFRQAR